MRMHAFNHDTPNEDALLDNPCSNDSQEESLTWALSCHESPRMEWREKEHHVTCRWPV